MIACTFPGKFGDLLWALPTVRAISETYDEPISLFVSRMLAPIGPLLELQPYVRSVEVCETWEVRDTAPMSPRIPPIAFDFDRIFHLGLDGWPLAALPNEVEEIWQKQFRSTGDHQTPAPIDLHRPWITVHRRGALKKVDLAVGFTDEWFELKYGICELLVQRGLDPYALFAQGSRWDLEGGWAAGGASNWIESAQAIQDAKVFLGCCSALHVLSVALGKQTVVMEPNEHRHHPIFWPEAVSDRVHPVIGGDGRLTFDARHTRELVEKFL